MQATASKNPDPKSAQKLAHRLRDDPTPRRHRPRASPAKHENVQPMSVQCCPIVFDAGPTLHQHRPHASRPPGYAYTLGLQMLLHAEGEVKNSQPQY